MIFEKKPFISTDQFATHDAKSDDIQLLSMLLAPQDDAYLSFLRWLADSKIAKNGGNTRIKLRVLLTNVISKIDAMLSRMVSDILHHATFKELETSWRGLSYLTDEASVYDLERNVKVKFMDLSWAQISKDVHKAIEFDQSYFFKNVYSNEFDSPGGEPFGVLIADYRISHKNRANVPYNDIDTLKLISQTAAAAFAPFICGAQPSFLGLNSFKDLGRPVKISEYFQQVEFTKWRSFRKHPDARYIGLTVPDILMRQPYRHFDCYSRLKFNFKERIKNPDTDYLWGSSAFAFGSVLIRTFSNYGWFAQIRGARRGEIDGGVVSSLPFDKLNVSSNIEHQAGSINVKISEKQEQELSHNGFIGLCSLKNSRNHVFYSNNSVQEHEQFNHKVANVNSQISSMLQYILSASRFAHYLKIISRNHVGNFETATDCQRYLQNWLHEYTTGSDSASMAVKAKYPLKEARVQVEEVPSKPGTYSCIAHLQPHFQMDQMVSSLRLVTALPAK